MSQDQKVLYPDGTRWVMASNVSRSAAVAIARPERAGRPHAAWRCMASNVARSATVAFADVTYTFAALPCVGICGGGNGFPSDQTFGQNCPPATISKISRTFGENLMDDALSTSGHDHAKPTLAVITIATAMMRMVAFTLPRCATRHKRGIQRYKARAGRQIVTLFEQAA